jgi:hypothetical protein
LVSNLGVAETVERSAVVVVASTITQHSRELGVAVAVEQTTVAVAAHCSGSINDGNCCRGKGKKKRKKKEVLSVEVLKPRFRDLDRRTDARTDK